MRVQQTRKISRAQFVRGVAGTTGAVFAATWGLSACSEVGSLPAETLIEKMWAAIDKQQSADFTVSVENDPQRNVHFIGRLDGSNQEAVSTLLAGSTVSMRIVNSWAYFQAPADLWKQMLGQMKGKKWAEAQAPKLADKWVRAAIDGPLQAYVRVFSLRNSVRELRQNPTLLPLTDGTAQVATSSSAGRESITISHPADHIATVVLEKSSFLPVNIFGVKIGQDVCSINFAGWQQGSEVTAPAEWVPFPLS